jgi:phage tail-like protein
MADPAMGKDSGTPTTGGTAPKSDPLLTFMFSVQGDIDGVGKIDGYFTEISGPGDEHDVVEFKATTNSADSKKPGGQEATVLVPGRNETNEVTLKRGLTTDMTFWKWRQLVRDGKIDEARTDVSITMYNRRYEPVVQWNLGEAWPKKITGPDFAGGNSDFGVEEIVLMYHTLEFTDQIGKDVKTDQNNNAGGGAGAGGGGGGGAT